MARLRHSITWLSSSAFTASHPERLLFQRRTRAASSFIHQSLSRIFIDILQFTGFKLICPGRNWQICTTTTRNLFYTCDCVAFSANGRRPHEGRSAVLISHRGARSPLSLRHCRRRRSGRTGRIDGAMCSCRTIISIENDH